MLLINGAMLLPMRRCFFIQLWNTSNSFISHWKSTSLSLTTILTWLCTQNPLRCQISTDIYRLVKCIYIAVIVQGDVTSPSGKELGYTLPLLARPSANHTAVCNLKPGALFTKQAVRSLTAKSRAISKPRYWFRFVVIFKFGVAAHNTHSIRNCQPCIGRRVHQKSPPVP